MRHKASLRQYSRISKIVISLLHCLSFLLRGPQSKKMREDTSRHQMYVSDVTEIPVTSTEEAYEQLLKGMVKAKGSYGLELVQCLYTL